MKSTDYGDFTFGNVVNESISRSRGEREISACAERHHRRSKIVVPPSVSTSRFGRRWCSFETCLRERIACFDRNSLLSLHNQDTH
jgi:hypothetical protein